MTDATVSIPGGTTGALVICTVAGVGGATRVVANLTTAFRKLGIPTRLVFPDPSSPDTAAALDWLASEDIAAEADPSVPAWYSPHGIRAMAALRRFVRESAPTATYLHYGSNQIAFRDVIAVRAARRGRCVVMVHHAAPIRSWRTRMMTRIGAILAHRIIVSTPVMADLVVAPGVRRSKIFVIPLGVPPPRSTPSMEPARTALGLPKDAFVVATVARLDRGKNVPHLVRAVAKLAAAGTDAHLVVAGVGDDFDAVSELGGRILPARVHMLGRVEDIDDVYAAADVFALPSREEGFGLVFLEAAWHAVPSVAYAVGGVPWAISDGVTGILVPLDDEQQLTAQLRRLHDDPALRRALGDAARDRVATEFANEPIAAQHLEVLGIRAATQSAMLV